MGQELGIVAPDNRGMTPTLLIHGGAGTLQRKELGPDREAVHHGALAAIALAGQQLLAQGASALDVAVEAVRLLEECPLFNAGKGAVFTSAGTHELDASVMDGPTQAAGAVTCVSRTRNPVLAAREVMRRSPHLLFASAAADALAEAWGLEMVAPDWFGTPERLAQWQRARGPTLDHDGARMGTVGAVALDAEGRLAAATSTGGMTAKTPGRVGDTPVVGAGCWADARVAVSCTGTGEAFMRICAAHDVAARVAYGGVSLTEAAYAVIHEGLPRMGGTGGLIAVAADGSIALPMHSAGMYRAVARVGAPVWTAIYADEGLPPLADR